MTSRTAMRLVATLMLLGFAADLCADEPEAAKPSPQEDASRHELLYKFEVGERLRWQVDHQASIQSTIQGTTQTAKTWTESVKVWKITDISPKGEITFIHSVDRVKMANHLPNRAKVEFDSQSDAEPPLGFEDVAKAIGVPLTMVRMSPRGKIIKREERYSQPASSQGTQIAMALPEQPVAIGEVWTHPHYVEVSIQGGSRRRVKIRQRFELKSVEGPIATIGVDYQVLDLKAARDPAIEAQLVQRLHGGTITFDITAGRVVSQDLTVDRRVIGFSGPSSSMHYATHLTEKLLDPSQAVARQIER